MELSKFGYVLPYKIDCKANLGVKEKFSFVYKGDDFIVNTMFGLDNRGNILIPAFDAKGDGYTPLTKYTNDIVTFCRSNKSLISVVNSLLVIAECKVTFDNNTHKVKEYKISLYSPLNVDTKNEKLIFGMLTTKDNMLNSVKVPEKLYQGYLDTVKNFFNYEDCKSKSDYIAARLKKAG